VYLYVCPGNSASGSPCRKPLTLTLLSASPPTRKSLSEWGVECECHECGWTGLVAELEPVCTHRCEWPPYSKFNDFGFQAKRQFIERMTSAIRNHKSRAFVVALRMADYNALVSSSWKTKMGSAYTFGTQLAMNMVAEYCDEVGHTDCDMVYTFERSQYAKEADEFLSEIENVPELIQRYRYRDHGFVGKRVAVPLQAADLLAYEALRDLLLQIEGVATDNQILYEIVNEQDRVLIMNQERVLNHSL
jgi:hypothetical protein